MFSVCENYRVSNIKEPLIGQDISILSFKQIGIDALTYEDSDFLRAEDYYSKWI